MRVLVTGGAGFIGSHVCDELLAQGHEVVALDDLSGGRRENLDARVRLHVADIRGPQAAALVERSRPEAICHLAAQVDVRRSMDDPRADADCNIAGLLNILEAARKAGTGRIVLSSSCAVYGEQEIYPAPETHPLGPATPYGCSKAACELYLGYYRQRHGLRFSALRYSNVYGPRQSGRGEAGVIAIFCGQLLAGGRCDINGSGAQTRDFVFVGDVARANALALAAGHDGALNVGTGVETGIATVHSLLAAEAGTKAAPRHLPAKEGEQRRSAVDPSLAAHVLGWQPAVALAEGLRLTFASYRKALAA